MLPPPKQKIETINIWKQESISRERLAELKGIANIIPNQAILINALILREARDSSEIENVITTQDKLYRALSSENKRIDPQTKTRIEMPAPPRGGDWRLRQTHGRPPPGHHRS